MHIINQVTNYKVVPKGSIAKKPKKVKWNEKQYKKEVGKRIKAGTNKGWNI